MLRTWLLEVPPELVAVTETVLVPLGVAFCGDPLLQLLLLEQPVSAVETARPINRRHSAEGSLPLRRRWKSTGNASRQASSTFGIWIPPGAAGISKAALPALVWMVSVVLTAEVPLGVT